MDEEQKKKFEEWWDKQWHLYGGRLTAEMAWEACLDANKVEERELSRTATITEWAERVMNRWAGTGCTWVQVLAWLLEQGFSLPKENEPDLSPTEMVKRLLEKGWTVEQRVDEGHVDTSFRKSGGGYSTTLIEEAYRKAFPSKKKIEVEVWMSKRGTVTEKGQNVRNSPYSKDWTKGIATFYVEDSGE